MPNDGQQSGGFLGTLKAKWGPLPVWGWLALVTVVLLGYWLYEQHKAGSSTNTNAPTPASVGQPGVVVINQDEGGEPSASPGAPIPPVPGGGKKPPKPPETRAITLTQDETLGELAKQRHWSSATLNQVEELNLTQGQGEWTPATQLKKGQTVIRPIRPGP